MSITTRAIAKAANVNVAAINYYFGSKENLFEIALKKAIDGYFRDLDAIVDKHNRSLRSALQAVFNYSLVGMVMYPGITRAHFHDPFMHNTYRSRYIKRLNTFLIGLIDRLEPGISKERHEVLQDKIMQCMASIMFVGFFPGMFEEFSNRDFCEPRVQKRYISLLMEHYFPE